MERGEEEYLQYAQPVCILSDEQLMKIGLILSADDVRQLGENEKNYRSVTARSIRMMVGYLFESHYFDYLLVHGTKVYGMYRGEEYVDAEKLQEQSATTTFLLPRINIKTISTAYFL